MTATVSHQTPVRQTRVAHFCDSSAQVRACAHGALTVMASRTAPCTVKVATRDHGSARPSRRSQGVLRPSQSQVTWAWRAHTVGTAMGRAAWAYRPFLFKRWTTQGTAGLLTARRQASAWRPPHHETCLNEGSQSQISLSHEQESGVHPSCVARCSVKRCMSAERAQENHPTDLS